MIVSGSSVGSREQIIGSYYMSSNEWDADQQNPQNYNFNLRGLVVCLDLYARTNAPGMDPGVCCAIPNTTSVVHALQRDSYSSPIGILLDDCVLKADAASGIKNRWVRVLHYGYTDRIMMVNGANVDTNDTVLLTSSHNSGFVVGATYSERVGAQALAGLVSLDTAAAGPVFMSLDGTDLAGADWISPPVVAAPAGLPIDRDSYFIGWHYRGDAPQLVPEVASGSVINASFQNISYVGGFVACLGFPHPW